MSILNKLYLFNISLLFNLIHLNNKINVFKKKQIQIKINTQP